MATASGYGNNNMTCTITVSGVAAGATSVRMTNTTTGVVLGEVAYNQVSATLTDSSPKMATVNSYSCTFYNGGQTIGTVTTSAIPYITVPAPVVTINGPYSGMSWSSPSEASTIYSRTDGFIYYRINGGAWIPYQSTGVAASGALGSTTVYVGYNSTIEWEIGHVYHAGGSYPDVNGTSTATGTTGAAPPSPPNPPSNLAAVDSGTSVALSWNAPIGGPLPTGYEVKRGTTLLGNQSATTKTDNAPGAARPVTYNIRAYISNSGGTAYSSTASVSVSGKTDSCGVLVG